MNDFRFSDRPLEPALLQQALADPAAGGYASFEGWVRDHHDGRPVRRLEYEAYAALAVKEGERIVAEAAARFGVRRASCVHRLGELGIGELAVWVGVSAEHRAEAFAACRYIIDEVKHRVPIWKKEHYGDGDSGWVNCEHCAAAAGGHDGPQGGDERHRHGDDGWLATRPAPQDYSRQMALPEVGAAGQARLRAASVLVIGAGGLGVPVLQYLAAAGVGRICLVDGDRVESSNLHRQPLYGPRDVGRPKVEVAAERLRDLNPEVRIEPVAARVDAANADALVATCDVVVECTDSLRSKFTINDAVVAAGRPAVYASVYQWEGQLQVYRPEPDCPCLRCVWPRPPVDGVVGNCAEAGVLGPVPAAIGALQAMEALKLLLGVDDPAGGSLLLFDLRTLLTRRVRATRDPACAHGRRGDLQPATVADDLELDFRSLRDARLAGYELLDIREPHERARDVPHPAIDWHLPLSQLLHDPASLPRDRPLLLVCAHGVRSLALAEMLRSTGHPHARSLRGGLAVVPPGPAEA